MAGERTLPGLGLTGFWNVGSDYKAQMDENLRRLSLHGQPYVLSSVATEPGSPTNGDIHRATGTWGGATAGQIVIRDNGAWVAYTPAEGWEFWDRTANAKLRFDGTTWQTIAEGGGGGGADDFLDLTDTPNAYTGQAGKFVAVKSDGTGLEFVNSPTVAPVQSTFRYWRLRIEAPGTQTASLSALVEVQLRETVGGADVATGGTASASQSSFGSTAANAFDDNSTTFWAADTVPSGDAVWLQYDFGLGNAKWISQYTVQARSGGEVIQCPRGFSLQYSADGVVWTTADTRGGLSWASGEVKTFTTIVPQPTSGGGGATTFLALTDTPAAYTGQAGKVVRVKADGTGLEFVDAPVPAISHKTISGAYTLVQSDLAGNVYLTADTSGGACTITVPNTLTGTGAVAIERSGVNDVTLVAGSGATIRSADGHLKLRTNFSVGALVPRGSNVYTLSGDLAA